MKLSHKAVLRMDTMRQLSGALLLVKGVFDCILESLVYKGCKQAFMLGLS